MDTDLKKGTQTIKPKKLQKTWIDLRLIDIRHLTEDVAQTPDIVNAGETLEEALLVLIEHLELNERDEIYIETPVGSVRIEKSKLTHVVEKRQDARERYVKLALKTLNNPFEVWSTAYDDESYRQAFIGVFEGKNQMLVIVSTVNGQVLWNFMHCDKKALNKHRHGELLHPNK